MQMNFCTNLFPPIIIEESGAETDWILIYYY